MLWWFERDGKQVRLEVLHLTNGTHELHFWDEDGKEIAETFNDASEVTERQRALRDTLAAQGWKPFGAWLL